MTAPSPEALKYYSIQGILSDLGKYTSQTEKLPSDTLRLSEIVQGIILHDMWIDRYGVTPKPGQWCNVLNPSMEDLLSTVTSIDNAEPFMHRAPGERVLACCREFSTMLCGILRAKGVPARARCGFAPYMAFEGSYEDHWMCEVWDNEDWRRIDPQIDSFQLKTIRDYAQEHDDLGNDYRAMLIGLDPQHLKQSDFMLAGEAWQKCRRGELNPDQFGISTNLSKYNVPQAFGMWFIRSNLVRDFLALNKIELLPFAEGLDKSRVYWNDWPIMQPNTTINNEEIKLLDMLAELTLDPDKNLSQIQQLFAETPELHPPQSILSSH